MSHDMYTIEEQKKEQLELLQRRIVEASIDYQLSKRPISLAGDKFADEARRLNRNQSFIDGANFILDNQWISVEDECPIGTCVLFDKNGNMRLDRFAWRALGYVQKLEITHWLPIPNLPKGGEQ